MDERVEGGPLVRGPAPGKSCEVSGLDLKTRKVKSEDLNWLFGAMAEFQAAEKAAGRG